MSEMVERVARAICVVAKGPDYPDADYYGKPGDPWRKWWESFVPEARAAIAAMREPTEAMREAALDADLDIYWGYMAEGPGKPGDVWRAMIGAALPPSP